MTREPRDEIVELVIANLREEVADLRKRLDVANRIICEQVAESARFIAEYYTRKYEDHEL